MDAGAKVTIVDRDAEQGAKTAAELGANAQFIECDVTDEGRKEDFLVPLSALQDAHGLLLIAAGAALMLCVCASRCGCSRCTGND